MDTPDSTSAAQTETAADIDAFDTTVAPLESNGVGFFASSTINTDQAAAVAAAAANMPFTTGSHTPNVFVPNNATDNDNSMGGEYNTSQGNELEHEVQEEPSMNSVLAEAQEDTLISDGNNIDQEAIISSSPANINTTDETTVTPSVATDQAVILAPQEEQEATELHVATAPSTFHGSSSRHVRPEETPVRHFERSGSATAFLPPQLIDPNHNHNNMDEFSGTQSSNNPNNNDENDDNNPLLQQALEQHSELPQAIPVPEPHLLNDNDNARLRSAGNFNRVDSGVSASQTAVNVVRAQPLEDWDEENDRRRRRRHGGDREDSNNNNNNNNNNSNNHSLKLLLFQSRPLQWALGFLLLVLVVIVGTVVGVMQSNNQQQVANNNNNNNNTTTNDASSVETSIQENNTKSNNDDNNNNQPFTELFPPFSDDIHYLTFQALNDPTSPQASANAWMMQDPQREQYDEERQLQRFSLATLYYSTMGDNWAQNDLWLDYKVDECHWFNKAAVSSFATTDTNGTSFASSSSNNNGDDNDETAHLNDVLVNKDDPQYFPCNEKYQIVNLNLAQNELNGVLPVELFFFPALTSLDLSYNNLYGTAPTMFAGARYLQKLVLSNNRLTGQFTAELGFVASQLEILQNNGNQFTGALPGLLRLLPNLYHLNISDNEYTGTLPASLNQLDNTLISLEVANNHISGTLPSELGTMPHLQLLDLGGNSNLRGTIPSQLSALVNLTYFQIQDTGISGSVPPALCELQLSGQLDLGADCNEKLQCCGS